MPRDGLRLVWQPADVTETILRARLENSQTCDDRSEDGLFLFFEDLAAGDALWVVIEKVGDTLKQTYAQAVRLADDSFQVERRCGSPDTHETVGPLGMRTAHGQLPQWAFALLSSRSHGRTADDYAATHEGSRRGLLK
jgi:hypothetical protein